MRSRVFARWETTVIRWLKFNFVGALGIGVQLAALSLLTAAGVWYLGATSDRFVKQGYRPDRTIEERFKLAADTPVCSCYEAGRDGFSLHRALEEKLGWHDQVIDSSSIEVTRKTKMKNSASAPKYAVSATPVESRYISAFLAM